MKRKVLVGIAANTIIVIGVVGGMTGVYAGVWRPSLGWLLYGSLISTGGLWVTLRSAIFDFPFQGWRVTMGIGAASYALMMSGYVQYFRNYKLDRSMNFMEQVLRGLQLWWEYLCG